jgi:hypothetical protein
MNRTEQAYAAVLEARKRAGEIRGWTYEAVTLRLARLCRYTPDFVVEENDGRVSLREVKGFMREDAAVKLKVAVEQFPMFRFWLVRPARRGAWREERLS